LVKAQKSYQVTSNTAGEFYGAAFTLQLLAKRDVLQ